MKGRIRLSAVVVVVAAMIAAVLYVGALFPQYANDFRYLYAGLILVAGIVLTREIAGLVARELRSELGDSALVASNGVAILGYVIAVLAAASYMSFSPTDILASAAAGGLVLGLALQPTLGSFFAGILILISGEIRPGTQVRILSWHIPYQWAFAPGYKFFSPDQIYPGFMGEVLEVGLFFTTLVTEEGQSMKLPNSILATDAAIIRYTSRDYYFNVRYEFPIRFPPDVVMNGVAEETKDFPVLRTYVNEQSDKEFYIVKMVLNAREKDHAELKSQILSRLIALHQRLSEKYPAVKA